LQFNEKFTFYAQKPISATLKDEIGMTRIRFVPPSLGFIVAGVPVGHKEFVSHQLMMKVVVDELKVQLKSIEQTVKSPATWLCGSENFICTIQPHFEML
jgi:hypothetical protein